MSENSENNSTDTSSAEFDTSSESPPTTIRSQLPRSNTHSKGKNMPESSIMSGSQDTNPLSNDSTVNNGQSSSQKDITRAIIPDLLSRTIKIRDAFIERKTNIKSILSDYSARMSSCQSGFGLPVLQAEYAGFAKAYHNVCCAIEEIDAQIEALEKYKRKFDEETRLIEQMKNLHPNEDIGGEDIELSAEFIRLTKELGLDSAEEEMIEKVTHTLEGQFHVESTKEYVHKIKKFLWDLTKLEPAMELQLVEACYKLDERIRRYNPYY